MGRPKGSRNKNSKSAPSASGPVTTEHNKAANSVDTLTDDQHHALVAQSAKKYAQALEEKKAADARFKATCKTIKSDGVELDDVKKYIEIGSPEGQKRIKADFEASIRIARWRNTDIGQQFKLFDETDTSSFQAGKEAGIQGQPAKPPAHADINEWLRGWGTGQAALMKKGFKEPKALPAPEPVVETSENDDEKDLRPPFLQESHAEPAEADEF